MNYLELINYGSYVLKKNKIPSHILDSEILLSKTLNKAREEILINLDCEIKEKDVCDFKNFLIRRANNEPIAYILKEKEFWSKNFVVSKKTLIPRPETELLVDKLIKIYEDKNISILDVGTGSGCIIISLVSSLKKSKGLGIDISKDAINIAKQNATKHQINHKVKFQNKSIEKLFNQKFDLIVSNPPYIETKDIKNLSVDIRRHEPRTALDGGHDGLDLIRKVIYKSKYILKLKGMLALEIGNEQIIKVSKILFDNNFRIKNLIKDYKNNVRCILAEYK